MVEKAIAQYIKGGGTAPFGIICGATSMDCPSGIATVCLPTLTDGTIGVVPLQTLIDLAAKTLWVMENDDDE